MDPVASKKCSDSFGVDMMRFREELQLYYMSQPSLTFLAGHFVWSDLIFEQTKCSWDYITVLRNPVDQWLSLYFYNRHKKSEHTRIDMELEEYLESDLGRNLGNEYLAKLSVRQSKSEALANLEKFRIVGVLEDIEAFEKQFRSCYGRRLDLAHVNRNPAADAKKSASADPVIRGKIEAICSESMEVFERALELSHRA